MSQFNEEEYRNTRTQLTVYLRVVGIPAEKVKPLLDQYREWSKQDEVPEEAKYEMERTIEQYRQMGEQTGIKY